MRRERGDKNARNGFLPYVRAVWWRTFALRLIDLDRASAFLDGFVFASSAISLAPAFFFFNFFFCLFEAEMLLVVIIARFGITPFFCRN